MHFCHNSAPLLLPKLKIFTNVTEVVDLLDSIGHSWTTLVVIGRKWRLSQCLFGEHLLMDKVNANVALVKSENTAVICFLLMPEYVWLATGGKSQLGNKLNVLHQRTIVAFPDVDGYELWKQKAGELSSLRITVSDYLESTATPEELEAHIDIADRLIAQLRDGTLVPPVDCPTASSPSSQYGTPLENPDFLQIAQYISPEYQDNVAIMLDELGLVPIDVCPLSQCLGRGTKGQQTTKEL